VILILSQATQEATTDLVMDWLECLGARCMRLNAEDLDAASALSYELTRDGTRVTLAGGGRGSRGGGEDGDGRGGGGGEDEGGGAPWELALNEVRAVWHRRWPRQRHQGEVATIAADHGIAEQARLRLVQHLNLEQRKLGEAVLAQLADCPWLGDPATASPNKLLVLERAAAAGLDVPATLVTTRRAAVARFAAEHGPLISKPIGEAAGFVLGERLHALHTLAVEPADIAALPAAFPASLFQERLDKRYELRVFYLAGECWAMAIFSQRDEQTRIDFRRYNHVRPNRTVPYRLTAALAAALDSLMRGLGLASGSLDLVRTPCGRTVFLEVNPVGQFGMVSRPCNYQLERRVAELLVRSAANAGAA
jgi:ATP-GRASP peptide maturase of grasp-with-spasm system